MRTLLRSKIHRCTVTQADLHYVGSITVDTDLMAAADLVEGELVHVVNINNGERFQTYVIPGPAGSGVIGVNGAAARLAHPGDLLILMAFGLVSPEELDDVAPRVVHVDASNAIVAVGADPSEPVPGDESLVSGAGMIVV